ncbi:MAG: FMN-binding negative transcriptional regulator [Burkholderiales bacterium]|jgi:transcriptional regulator|nr:FMN-binding negative transcriptional regulator [Burkholderiales bacterium]MCA3226851.1 FMN-binding negative transcriptional regulator [Burkholderiales bacterium]MCE2644547.1 FMN-binding negative transcriptional regulator [Burkholderiaceae bacterium]
MLYEPRHFKVDDRALAIEIMLAHPFATLASVIDGEPVFTHLPLHAVQDGSQLHLVGHIARANGHGVALDGGTATAIFHGGNAFISPSLYAVREAVPTWNYIAVHVTGRVERMDSSEAKESVLKTLIDRHDPAYRAQWDEELSADYKERQKGAIVGLRLHAERVQAKFKLSQNRPVEDQRRVRAAMAAGDASAQALGAWMRRLHVGDAP